MSIGKLNILHVINKDNVTSVPMQWCDSGDTHNYHKCMIFKNIPNLIDGIRKSDILHLHHVKSALFSVILAKYFGKKTIYTMHGSFRFLSLPNQLMIYLVFIMVDKVIFVNKHLADDLPNYLHRIVLSKSDVVLNGVSIKQMNRIEQTIHAVHADRKYVFHPARHVDEKNMFNLIHAFNIAKDECDCDLVLAGAGPLTSQLKKLVDDLDLEARVKFLGLIPRSEVMHYMKNCSCFIMPSISEGLNVAFLEALAFKKKCIVSKIPSFESAFIQWNLSPQSLDTYFVDPNSIISISTAIRSVFRTECVHREVLDDREFLSLERMFHDYNVIYRVLI